MIMQAIRPSLVLLVLFTLILGFAYPAISSVFILSLFRPTAEGSLIKDRDGTIKGSMLIGQNFSEPRHFWGRLSATSPAYNAAATSGSNLGVNNPALLANVQARVDALKAADPDNTASIPVDLVTASGSGLDPHISPAAAAYQIGPRCKSARSRRGNRRQDRCRSYGGAPVRDIRRTGCQRAGAQSRFRQSTRQTMMPAAC